MGPGGTGFLSGVSKIAAGERYSMALRTDGTVWGWGENNMGQLGDNSTTTRPTPVQVVGVGGTGFLTGVEDISAGGASNHTLALKPDGTLYGWGYNGDGQLGNGSTSTPQLTPTQVVNTSLGQVPGSCRLVGRVQPGTGGQAGGTTVTITGRGFLGATQVTFSGVPATSFTVVSDTQITAVTPAHQPGSTDVQVTTPRGTTQVQAADVFVFTAPVAALLSTPTPSPAPTPALPKAGDAGGSLPGSGLALFLLAAAVLAASVLIARRLRRLS
jgi:hypothetical protein